MSTVVILCRRGFEGDAAAEIAHHAAHHGFSGEPIAQVNRGFATFEGESLAEAEALLKTVSFSQLVFARQWFVGFCLSDLPAEDRITAIKDSVDAFPLCGALSVVTADTNEGKALSKLCSKIAAPLAKALQKRNKLTRQPKPKRPALQVMFLSSTQAFVGYAFPDNCSPFAQGIPRLKMPADAPSRSTLKLDEAFQVFLSESAAQTRIRPGMRAVDLGACPGGWTYQLVRRGLFVSAVDNGELQTNLLETGQVEHFKADGFKFRPRKRDSNVWLVCDMVEKPTRITALMLEWVVSGHAREVIFNLKLPMKKRFETVYACLAQIRETLTAQKIEYACLAKQLYHDREEITVYLHVASPVERSM